MHDYSVSISMDSVCLTNSDSEWRVINILSDYNEEVAIVLHPDHRPNMPVKPV